MNSTDKEKIEKEIEYWSKHLDLDKLNISIAIDKSNHNLLLFLSVLAIIMTALPFLLTNINISFLLRSIIFLILGLTFYILWKSGDKKYKKEINYHNLSFIVRERMIQQRYEDFFHFNKDKLNIEFEEIKSIYKNPEINLIEFLIKEYYKNGQKESKKGEIKLKKK